MLSKTPKKKSKKRVSKQALPTETVDETKRVKEEQPDDEDMSTEDPAAMAQRVLAEHKEQTEKLRADTEAAINTALSEVLEKQGIPASAIRDGSDALLRNLQHSAEKKGPSLADLMSN